MDLEKWLSKLVVQRRVVSETSNTLANNVADIVEASGMLAMPGVPAGLTGYSVYHTLITIWPEGISIILAVAVGVAFEALGLTAAHNLVKVYRSYRHSQAVRGIVTAYTIAASGIYILVVGGIIIFAHALPGIVAYVGPASPLLAVCLYVSRFLAFDLDQNEQQYQTQVDREEALADERHQLNIEQMREEMRLGLEDKREKLALDREITRMREQARSDRAMAKLERQAENAGNKWKRPEIFQYLRDNPDVTNIDLAQMAGVTPRTIYNYRKELYGKEI